MSRVSTPCRETTKGSCILQNSGEHNCVCSSLMWLISKYQLKFIVETGKVLHIHLQDLWSPKIFGIFWFLYKNNRSKDQQKINANQVLMLAAVWESELQAGWGFTSVTQVPNHFTLTNSKQRFNISTIDADKKPAELSHSNPEGAAGTASVVIHPMWLTLEQCHSAGSQHTFSELSALLTEALLCPSNLFY